MFLEYIFVSWAVISNFSKSVF